MGNALQAAALRLAPALDKIRLLMNELPVSVHQLSGSGSAYYALCGSARESRRVASLLRASRLGEVYTTTTF